MAGLQTQTRTGGHGRRRRSPRHSAAAAGDRDAISCPQMGETLRVLALAQRIIRRTDTGVREGGRDQDKRVRARQRRPSDRGLVGPGGRGGGRTSLRELEAGRVA